VVNRSLTQPRLNTLLLAAFAVLALLLASMGIYSVHGLFLALVGITVGLAAAFGLTRLLASLLFGVRPTDPIILVTVCLVLTAVALLASYLPARRAMEVDPMVALRHE
jgi:putative ABC transport system permease protein